MALYTLRSTWRLTDGRGGSIVTVARIEAETAPEAIARAKAEPEPDLPVQLRSMHLSDPTGRVFWSLSGPKEPDTTHFGGSYPGGK